LYSKLKLNGLIAFSIEATIICLITGGTKSNGQASVAFSLLSSILISCKIPKSINDKFIAGCFTDFRAF
jgi:hypothetical protein